jgi:hypothetical protein
VRIVPVVLALCLAALPAFADKSPEEAYFEDSVTKAVPKQSAATKGDKKGRLGSAKMRRANEYAAEVVKTRMKRTRQSDLKLLRKAGAADVVVVTGSYDRVQDVLRAMDVEHVVIPPRLVGKLELMSTQTLMVNCPGAVPGNGIATIRNFVHRGGYLITTDWALKRVLQRAFPKKVKHNGINTKDDVVAVHVHDSSEPLLAHVKMHKDNPRWWLEASSYPIRILDKKNVKVLMSSPEMKKKYGEGAVVVSFRHGDGKVLHMTSHFFLQQSKLARKSEKKKGSAFAKGAGLSDKDVAAMKKKGLNLDDVAVGDLNSAYSMQQLSTNKQKANKRLLKKYKARMRRKSSAGKTEFRKDFRVKVLQRKGEKVKVEDLFGRKGWVNAADVME